MRWRKHLQAELENLSTKVSHAPPEDIAGVLNYAITVLLLKTLPPNPRYRNLNEVIGVLAACQQEFYRKKVVPYERKKAEIEGEVYW